MRISATIILLFISCSVFAQPQVTSRAELEKRRQNILESIRETQEQLEATKKDKKATLSQLRALQAKLDARQRLIGNINDEMSQIDNNIHASATEVTHLQQRLEILKFRYAQSVRYAYKNRNSYNMLAFLFSSNDFNDALRRLKYLHKYRDYRKEQADQIRVTQGVIKEKIGVLNNQKTEKSVLLTAQEQQKLELQKETNQTNQVAQELKGREKELAADIARNQKAAKDMQRAIERIIQREIEIAARKKAEEDARKKAAEEARLRAANAASRPGTTTPAKPGMKAESERPANTGVANNNPSRPIPAATHTRSNEDLSYKMTLTPEATALANGFEANRGRLPWPVEKGFVSAHFGPHPHPLEPKVIVDNAGVNITTSAGAAARAVYDGTVTSIITIPGAGTVVVISHGTYFTVYGGLASTNVQKNQSVKTKQVIGTIGPNDDGVPVIDFQVWKVSGNNHTSKIDPEGWIAR